MGLCLILWQAWRLVRVSSKIILNRIWMLNWARFRGSWLEMWWSKWRPRCNETLMWNKKHSRICLMSSWLLLRITTLGTRVSKKLLAPLRQLWLESWKTLVKIRKHSATSWIGCNKSIDLKWYTPKIISSTLMLELCCQVSTPLLPPPWLQDYLKHLIHNQGSTLWAKITHRWQLKEMW